MSTFRWARASGVCVVLLLAAVVPAITGAAPASANHVLGVFLQVTPEVTTVDVNTEVTLTARLFTAVVSSNGTQRQPSPGAGGIEIAFAFETGPVKGQDPRCSIAQTATSCEVKVTSDTAGSSLARAWIVPGTPELQRHKDGKEGRLANRSDDPRRADADCITEEEGETDAASCRTTTPDDTTGPGEVEPESDATDVVRITWKDRGLDVQPETQNRALGETATLTATAYNQAGSPLSGVPVKFEFFEGSVSFPGKLTTPATPDKTCTTGANGTCTVTTTATANGVDVICAWTMTSPPTPTVSGKATETATCNGETLLDLSANDGEPSPADDHTDIVRIFWGTGGTTSTTAVRITTSQAAGTGYWLTASDGGVFAFGEAVFRGSTGGLKLNQPIVAMAATPTQAGYWLVASDGGVFAFGDAVFRGSTGGIKLNQPIVGIAPTPSGNGYLLVAKDGGIFAFGGAVFRGSAGALKLAQPIVGIAPTPTGAGYWLVAADGGVFAYGDAVFRGSTGGIKLAKPIVGIASTSTGRGYWLVAEDGGVFAFGDAVFRGSTGGLKLVQPMVGMSRSGTGAGYRLVAKDGGVFAFGDATFRGSTGALRINQPVVGMSGF